MGAFSVPERPRVSRIRHTRDGQTNANEGVHQPLPGFPNQYRDIVDFITRITHRIWTDGDVGLINETYDPDCVVHTAVGVGRGVERVAAGTISAMAAFPEVEDHFLNVAWSDDGAAGFYTSHLGFGRVVNAGDSLYGPATRRSATVRYCADCVTLAGRIHTEWLARDNGAVVRQLGLDLHDAARRLASSLPREPDRPPASKAPSRQARNVPLDISRGDLEGHLRHLFHDIWNRRRLDVLADVYSADVQIHTAGGRVARGIPALRALHISLMASMPDCGLTVENVCWSDETDGVIGAVRWELRGTGRGGGWLGGTPDGVPLAIPGMTHCRFDGSGRIAEEWTVWDEVAVLAGAYRVAEVDR